MATDLRRSSTALDPGSFERFYRRHLAEIYRFVLRDVGNRADAEEVTQAAFLDAYRALRRGHEPDRPRAWMYGIARNATLRRYRTQSRRPREVELGPELAERVTDEEAGQELEAIRTAIAGLRPNHREVVFLREVEGLSYAEIARRLGTSRSAVETLLFRARRSLRELLEAEGLRPAVRSGRGKRLGGVVVLPAFLGRLAGRGQQLFPPELATKAAGALTAVALSAGVVVGVQSLPLDAATPGEAAPKARSLSSTPLARMAVAGRQEPGSQGRSAKEAKRKDRDGGKDRKPDRDESRPSEQSNTPAAAGSDDPAGGSGASPVGGTAIPTPAVSVPAVQVPPVTVPAIPVTPVPEVPPVSTPPVDIPPVTVELPGGGGLPGG